MPKIAISYRRADSEAMTGRIFDRLIAHYGKEAIFRDIDDIPPGIDFRVHINQTLLKTHILLAIVGPHWLGMASDGSADRIQEESDPVRVEVETALRRRVPLIPVLIGTTKMPSSDQLPPSLKDFAFRNAVKVDTGQDFDYHMDRLIRSMDAILEQAPKSPPSRETKTPTPPKPSTAERGAAAAAIAEAPRKKDTGSRAAAQTPAADATAKAESFAKPVSFMSSATAPGDWRDMAWPADQQGRMLRLGIAGAAAVLALVALVFGLSGGSGNQGQRLLTLSGHSGAVTSVAFSPSGQTLVSGSTDKSIRLWDAGSGQSLRTMSGDSETVSSVAFTPNGKRIVSGSFDRAILIWDANSGQLLRTLRDESSASWQTPPAVWSIAISPDGTRIVAGSGDAAVKVWNLDTGEQLPNPKYHNDVVTSVAFFPNGKTIVSASKDATVKIWDIEARKPLRTLTDHPGQILSVAVSPDGKRIAAGGSGNSVIIWNAATGQQVGKLDTESDTVEFGDILHRRQAHPRRRQQRHHRRLGCRQRTAPARAHRT